MTSTAPAVKKALVTDDGKGILQKWSGLAGVQVCYGHPGKSMRAELIWLTTIVWDGEHWANANRTGRDETYEITLWVDVHDKTGTQQDTTDRAYELLAEVEKCLRQDVRNPTGVAGVYQVEVVPRRSREGILTEGRWADIEAAIRVKARK